MQVSVLSARRPPPHELDLGSTATVPVPRPASPLAHLALEAPPGRTRARAICNRFEGLANPWKPPSLAGPFAALPEDLQRRLVQESYQLAAADPIAFVSNPQRAIALVAAAVAPTRRNAVLKEAVVRAIELAEPKQYVDICMQLSEHAPGLLPTAERSINAIAIDPQQNLSAHTGAICALLRIVDGMPHTAARTARYHVLHALAQQQHHHAYPLIEAGEALEDVSADADQISENIDRSYDALYNTRLHGMDKAEQHALLRAAATKIEFGSELPQVIVALARHMPERAAGFHAFAELHALAERLPEQARTFALLKLIDHLPPEHYADAHAMMRASLHGTAHPLFYDTLHKLLKALPPGTAGISAHMHVSAIARTMLLQGALPDSATRYPEITINPQKNLALAAELLAQHIPAAADAEAYRAMQPILASLAPALLIAGPTFRHMAFALPTTHADAPAMAATLRTLAANGNDPGLMALTALCLPNALERSSLVGDCAPYLAQRHASWPELKRSLELMHSGACDELMSLEDDERAYPSLHRFQSNFVEYILPQLGDFAMRRKTINYLLNREDATTQERTATHALIRRYAQTCNNDFERNGVMDELLSALPRLPDAVSACGETIPLVTQTVDLASRCKEYLDLVVLTSDQHSRELQTMRQAVLSASQIDRSRFVWLIVYPFALLHTPFQLRTLAECKSLQSIVNVTSQSQKSFVNFWKWMINSSSSEAARTRMINDLVDMLAVVHSKPALAELRTVIENSPACNKTSVPEYRAAFAKWLDEPHGNKRKRE